MKGFFVTGTDTGVGKTIISCGIAAALKKQKFDVGVFKPFLSGISRTHPESDTAMLKRASQTSLTYEDITPFEYKEPLAPYTAAKLEGKIITTISSSKEQAASRCRSERIFWSAMRSKR